MHMTDSEKWAWWTLGAIGLSFAAYFLFAALLGSGPAQKTVFWLQALLVVPASSHLSSKGRLRDEREKEIANKALLDRKSTRLNSSHLGISYAVFCLKKK